MMAFCPEGAPIGAAMEAASTTTSPRFRPDSTLMNRRQGPTGQLLALPNVGGEGTDKGFSPDAGKCEDADKCFSPDTRQANEPITHLYPTQMLDGTSGVYLLSNADGVGVGVFKPLDEEHLPAEASSWAVSSGTGYFRERAAYVVSDQVLQGISDVPDTRIVTVKHDGWVNGEKRGSLQRFVPEAQDMSDRGPANIPADEVHKVGILDICLFNMDRHEGNLLLLNQPKCDSLSLVPIDHGLCLPEIISAKGVNHELLKNIYFVWQNWPQARQPFSDAVRCLLDRQLASDMLRTVVGKLREDMGRHTLTVAALTTLKIGALVLRDTVRAGLNLSEIATLVSNRLPALLQASWDHHTVAASKEKNAAAEEGRHAGAGWRHTAAEGQGGAAGEGVLVPVTGRLHLEEQEALYLAWEAEFLSTLEALLCADLERRSPVPAATQAATTSPEEVGSIYSRFEQDALRGGWQSSQGQVPGCQTGEEHLDGCKVKANARFEMIGAQPGGGGGGEAFCGAERPCHAESERLTLLPDTPLPSPLRASAPQHESKAALQPFEIPPDELAVKGPWRVSCSLRAAFGERGTRPYRIPPSRAMAVLGAH